MIYKMLALDMDGTLLNSQKKISLRTSTAIKKLSERGVYVVTSTGRNLPELSEYSDSISCMNFGILMSGGMVFDFRNDIPITIHALDEEITLQLIDYGLQEDAMVHLHSVRQSVAREKDILHMAYFDVEIYQAMFERLCIRCDDLKKYVREHPNEILKVNLYHRSQESRDRNLARIEQLNVSITPAEVTNLEMVSRDISKATGLLELCDFLKIDVSEVVAIGDAPNDKEILQIAGLGIAMGNASDEIKKIADFVTLDNDSDGVAFAIGKIFSKST